MRVETAGLLVDWLWDLRQTNTQDDSQAFPEQLQQEAGIYLGGRDARSRFASWKETLVLGHVNL